MNGRYNTSTICCAVHDYENDYDVSSSSSSSSSGSNLRISWKRLKKATGIFRKIRNPAGWDTNLDSSSYDRDMLIIMTMTFNY
jgi:hypothetical protein